MEKKIALQYCVDVRNQKYVLQILVKDGYLEYAKRQKAWMKRELLRFDIPYGVKNKLRHFINPFGSFFYFRKKNAVFVDRRGKTDIADSQHCKQIQVTDGL